MSKIFVYGTLRQGFGNHRLLEQADFLGSAVTVEDYSMFGGGIPFVNPNVKKYPIVGEVYEVNENQLKRLDALEGHPDWYYRTPIEVKMDVTGEIMNVEIYFNDYDTNLFPTGDYKENIAVRKSAQQTSNT